MAAKVEPLMTVEDIDAMPEDGNRYEVIEGELFVSRAPGLPHQIISVNIVYEFKKYLDQHPIGLVIPTPGLVFSQYSGVIPDIVIEILSPVRENVSRDRVAKRQLYAKHGVEEYWIVDSENRSVEIYRLASEKLEPAKMLRDQDEITSRLLPGFTCPLASIFKQ